MSFSSHITSFLSLLFLRVPTPSRTTLFPYTTLFRSHDALDDVSGFGPPRSAIGVGGHLVGEDPGDLHPHSGDLDRKSTRLNSSHVAISYAVFCLKKKKNNK